MTRHIKIQREYEIVYKSTWTQTDRVTIQAEDEDEADHFFWAKADEGEFRNIFIENKPPKDPEIEIEFIEVEGGLA